MYVYDLQRWREFAEQDKEKLESGEDWDLNSVLDSEGLSSCASMQGQEPSAIQQSLDLHKLASVLMKAEKIAALLI